jgi:hypothetical protein
MALTLGVATTISTAARNAQADAFDTLVNTGTVQTLVLIDSTGPTVLVTFTLDTTNAFGNASSGAITVTGLPLSATASAGAAATAESYEIRIDGTACWTGGVTGADTITSGQTVNLTAFTITWPAS